jgi:hypothetical protein
MTKEKRYVNRVVDEVKEGLFKRGAVCWLFPSFGEGLGVGRKKSPAKAGLKQLKVSDDELSFRISTSSRSSFAALISRVSSGSSFSLSFFLTTAHLSFMLGVPGLEFRHRSGFVKQAKRYTTKQMLQVQHTFVR